MTKTADLARYVEKDLSPTSKSLAEWITEHTGYVADERTVSLVQDLHSAWQKGPENQKRIAEAKTARAAAEVAKAVRVATKAAEPKPTTKPVDKPAAKTAVKTAAARPRRVAQKKAAE